MNDNIKTVEYTRNELDQLELAYCCTCHKLQGSGYNTVIIIIDMTHYTLLDTCLLYTAITRAKKRCLLLAEPKAYKMCIETNKSQNRQTWLKYF
jgi:exodeoxyribonuclease V alpha subunit